MGNFHNYRTLQVELWEDCNYHCPFCYLGENRRTTTSEQKLEAIKKTNEILDKVDDKYDAFGIIGGEFFDNQLNTAELVASFKNLISRLDAMPNFKQVWITSALMTDVNKMFTHILADVKDKNKFLICTSYDTVGRFKTNKVRDLWFHNIECIKQMGFKVHIQTILTSDFIDEALTTNILEQLSNDTMVDFKTPTPQRDAYIDAVLNKDGRTYREIIKENMVKFSPTFFITDRNKFLEFMVKVKEVFGPEKIEAFCSNEVRSDELHLISKGIVIKDRWGDGIENAPCGHPWDSYCYANSEKCARCDAQNLLEDE